MARVKPEEPRNADESSFINRAKEYAFIKSQMEYLEKQQKELREQLFEYADLNGEVDDKGNIILELPDDVEGYSSVIKQKRVTRKVDEFVAEEIITEKGMEETLYKTIRVVDEDALMAALYNDELTEDEIDRMYPQKDYLGIGTKEVTVAGLRGQDEIEKAFADLEYIPGSKKKRREIDPKVSCRKVGESNGWDANPTIKMLGGKETEVFTIGALASALEKSIVSVRLWERKGYIPRAPYRLRSKTLKGQKTGGNRVYTRALIESAIEEFSKRGLLGTARVEWNQHEDLTEALVKRWKDITSIESQQ